MDIYKRALSNLGGMNLYNFKRSLNDLEKNNNSESPYDNLESSDIMSGTMDASKHKRSVPSEPRTDN